MKRYEITARGKFTASLISFAILICVIALVVTSISPGPEGKPSPAASPSGDPSGSPSGSVLDTPTPDTSPSPEVSAPSHSPTPDGSLEPIPVPTPSRQPVPSDSSQSWSNKNLLLAFDSGSSELSDSGIKQLSQFMGSAPDLTGWIMVVEGYCSDDEDASLQMDRAYAIRDHVTDNYGIPSNMVLPIKSGTGVSVSQAEVYFMISGSK